LGNFWLRIKFILFILFSQIIFAGSNAPYSYSYTPKFVYQNQIFPVSVHIKHFEGNSKIHFEYDRMSLNQPINSKPVIVTNANEAFYTFYFKAKNNQKTIEIPTLAIWNLDQTYILNAIDIYTKKLDTKKQPEFSGVIASALRLNSVKIDSYDDEHILITLDIEAKEANLEDMHIPNVIDDGIENIKREGSNVSANYYFIVNSTLNKIKYSYYNIINKEFKLKTLDIKKYKNRTLNVQLNPKELSFDKFKKYFLVVITLLFALLFLMNYDKIYLLVFLISGSTLFYVYLSNKTICIQEGASLYILPTKNSNISLRIDNKIERKVIKKYKNFNKIEYKKSVTGWIKDDELCKD